MADMDDKELFINAINNLPDDILTAKYDGYRPRKKARRKDDPESPFDKTIDLHGLIKAEALTVLRNTLSIAKGKRRKILVITGKGNNSEGGCGVIREAVLNFLRKAGSIYIREYKFASGKNGGDGAIEILTK